MTLFWGYSFKTIHFFENRCPPWDVIKDRSLTFSCFEYKASNAGKQHVDVYYIDKSVLVENRPLVKFIRNYIRGRVAYFPYPR